MNTTSYNVMNHRKRDTNFLNHIGLTPYYSVSEGKVIEPIVTESTTVNNKGNTKPQFFYPDDARTLDNFRGLPLLLDKPAYVGCVNMDDAFSRNNSQYKFSSYDGYQDMNNGQIAYYIDKSISQPYFSPVYTITSTTEKKMLVDPMGANLPQYRKIPYSTTLNAVSKYQTTRDTLSHREDLMALQSRKRDQQSYVYYNMN